VEIVYTLIFEEWLKGLYDQRAKASIASRIERIEDGNFGDNRSVGGGISELPIDVGQGYRVYYTIRNNTLVILLCGGGKSSQRRDIRRARQVASEI
jgi:putative addiction module killer protein